MTIVLSCSIVDVISEKEYIDLKQNLIRIISPQRVFYNDFNFQLSFCEATEVLIELFILYIEGY